jgi:hypothetical protein
MRKFRVNVKSYYNIQKITKMIKGNFPTINYEVYEVSGPSNFKMEFISRKDAKEFIDNYVISAYENLINLQIETLKLK